MDGRVVLLAGFSYMSDDRVSWTEDYLSLFEPALQGLVDKAVVRRINPSASGQAGIVSGDLVIGHELPLGFTKRLSQEEVRYIDIRISPVRFCSEDNLFAFGSNDGAISQALLGFRVPDQELFVEAKSLSLSFRYRDLGQLSIADNALVFFTEQPVDRNSIHFSDPARLADYREELEGLVASYGSSYYIHRADDQDEEPMFLRSLGFRRCDVNLYAVLSSRQVRGIAAIRSGVLEEARYFGVPAIRLGDATTPLATDMDPAAEDRFINISPKEALSTEFWYRLLNGQAHDGTAGTSRKLSSHNLVRRALNNWNSAAAGIELDSEHWHELVQKPLSRAIDHVRDEAEFRQIHTSSQVNDEVTALAGEWRWFTGETVRIEAGGHVRSADDYGVLRRSGEGLTISWHKRQLIDVLTVASGGRAFETRNQYGHGGTVQSITDS